MFRLGANVSNKFYVVGLYSSYPHHSRIHMLHICMLDLPLSTRIYSILVKFWLNFHLQHQIPRNHDPSANRIDEIHQKQWKCDLIPISRNSESWNSWHNHQISVFPEFSTNKAECKYYDEITKTQSYPEILSYPNKHSIWWGFSMIG